MSKAVRPSLTPVSEPSFSQPYYVVGEKVTYSWNGRALPCLVASVQQSKGASDGNGVTYTVQGDITGGSYPAGAPKGPFKGVIVANLADRT